MTNDEFEGKLKQIEANIEILKGFQKVNEEIKEAIEVENKLGGNE